MPLTIIHKHSDATTAGVADPPLNTDLASGELGINFSADDPALYIVDNANTVRKIQGTPNRKFTLQNDDVNLVGGDATTAINAALVSGAIIPSVASLLISDQVEVQDSGNPDANANVTVGRYFYDGAIWFSSGGGGGASVTVGDTAPISPAAGDLWWDSSEAADSNGGRLYLWYEDGDSNQWVQTSNVGGGGGGGGSSVSVGDTAPATPKAGDLWWDSANDGGRLWVWYEDADSNQWVEASPNQVGSSFWSRDDATTTVSPSTAGDSVDVGSGNIALNADGSATFAGELLQSSAGGYIWTHEPGSANFYSAMYANGSFESNPAAGAQKQYIGKSGGTVNFVIENNGSLEIGPTANPTITLNANGDIASFFASGNPFCTIKPTTKKLTVNGFPAEGMTSGSIVFATTWAGTETIQLAAGGTANKPGGGTWSATSDARAKEEIIDYSAGLAELKQIHPRSYRYIGNEKTFIGLVAQEAEGAMPELVTKGKGTLPNGTEVDDFRILDQTPLTFALINAVKEMSTRIEALEAEVTALKGGTTK